MEEKQKKIVELEETKEDRKESTYECVLDCDRR